MNLSINLVFYRLIFHFIDPSPKGFIDSFLCGYLPPYAKPQRLLTLKTYGGQYFLSFNDFDEVSTIYCRYQAEMGKDLKKEKKRKNSNIKNILKYLEQKRRLLKKGRHGINAMNNKQFAEYKIESSELLDKLREKYEVKKPEMVIILTCRLGFLELI